MTNISFIDNSLILSLIKIVYTSVPRQTLDTIREIKMTKSYCCDGLFPLYIISSSYPGIG